MQLWYFPVPLSRLQNSLITTFCTDILVRFSCSFICDLEFLADFNIWKVSLLIGVNVRLFNSRLSMKESCYFELLHLNTSNDSNSRNAVQACSSDGNCENFQFLWKGILTPQSKIVAHLETRTTYKPSKASLATLIISLNLKTKLRVSGLKLP